MKTILTALTVAGCVVFAHVQGQEVTYASASYDLAEVNAPSEVVYFLLNAMDTHLMNIEGSTLAWTNADSQEIKDYAEKLMIDHGLMLGYIKKMAVLREINLPDDLSDERREECDRLAGMTGDKFERKFLNSAIDECKRDLELFRKATHSSDPEIREFAEKYIPVLDEHLKQAKSLRTQKGF